MINKVVLEGIVVKTWKYADDLLFHIGCYRDPDMPSKGRQDGFVLAVRRKRDQSGQSAQAGKINLRARGKRLFLFYGQIPQIRTVPLSDDEARYFISWENDNPLIRSLFAFHS